MEEILEKLCENRYTENDPDYKETIEKPTALPPCVDNWYIRPRRQWDYTRGNRGQGHRGQGYRGRGHQDYHHHNQRGGSDRGSYRNHHNNQHRERGYHRDEPSRNMYAGKREYYGDRHEPYRQGQRGGRGGGRGQY